MASADMIRESQDPSTTGARLAELAQADRSLWPAIAVHPAAYPALLDWLGQQGDPTVDAVLALRSGSPAAETPTAPATHGPVPANSGDSKNLWVVCGMVAVVLVLIGGVAFGATKVFGGDDDGKDEASSSQTVDAPTADSPDSSESSDPPAAGPSSDAFCDEFKDAQRAIAGSPDAAPGSAAETAKATAAIMRDIERVAPAEVTSDIRVMGDYFETMSDPSTLDTSTISERVREFTAAARRVSTYSTATCG